MSIFFTSDTHFNHHNIISYCQRPFIDTVEMNEALTANWNQVVKADDTVYHVGDFALGGKQHIASHRARLNGKIVLIRGNHDPRAEFMQRAGFEAVHESLSLRHFGQDLFLHHEPVLEAYWPPGTALHLCGHVHTRFQRVGKTVNVGVDVWGYRPVSLEQILTASLQDLDIAAEIGQYEAQRKNR